MINIENLIKVIRNAKKLSDFHENFLKIPKKSGNSLFGPPPKACYEGQKDIIDVAIHRTRKEHILPNKVLFEHPVFEKYGCDIFGGVYSIDGIDHLVMLCFKGI